MACNGADGDGRTAPGANALIETNDVTILPSFQVVVSDDHVGGFDKSELQVLIGFFLKVAVMELATGTGYPGCGAAIGGKGIGMGEPGDVPDFAIDDNGKDISNAGKGLEQLDTRSFLNALTDTVLKGGDFLLDVIQQDEFLLDATVGFGWQLQDSLVQPTASGLAEELFAIVYGQGVLGEGGVDPVLDGVPKFGKGHPGPRQFSFIADLVRGDPDGGEGAIVLQDGQPMGVDLVGLACLSADRLTLPIMTLALAA
jgi:hypothetical protein